jgi:hypothetical protein
MTINNENRIPIITIHNGNHDYFKKILEINSRHNSNIIVLSDRDDLDGTVKYVNYSNMKIHEMKPFIKAYEHLNTTPYDYELFCYLRWFIILQYMKDNDLDVIFHIDSDVLYFANPDEEFEKFKYFEFTLIHRSAGCTSFFTRNGLENFCEFLFHVFQKKESYEYKKIASHFQVRQDSMLPGGVCDMTLFQHYDYKNAGLVGEMMYVIDDSTYDHNINEDDGAWEFENGLKKFTFKEGIPHCFNRRIGKEIRFNSIHLQGGAKNFVFNLEGMMAQPKVA